MTVNSLGIYEKALPQDLSWKEKFNLVKKLGFNFLEFSVDESDARLARLDWTKEQRKEFRDLMWDTDIRINNLMLSGHRRFPLGSKDPETRKKSLEMCQKAVDLCVDLGIHNIQMAGYDVYYEEKSENSRELYVENLAKCVHMAAKKNIMLSIETMDDPFITNIADIKQYKKQVRSPWLQAYPDLGNLSAWPQNDPAKDLENGIGNIVAIHLKDTLAVTDGFEGKFRDVPFGYDVYYEEKSENSRELYVENLAKCVHMAAKKNIMLSIETMDDPFITNIADIKQYKKQVRSPWLQAYPDLGNLSAWPQNDPAKDLENGIGNIVAIHLKDTLAVTDGFEGKFRDVPFGEGCVDFEGLLRELVRLDYNGSFTIEMWPGDNGDDDPVAEVKEAKAFFDKIFKKVGIEQEPVD